MWYKYRWSKEYGEGFKILNNGAYEGGWQGSCTTIWIKLKNVLLCSIYQLTRTILQGRHCRGEPIEPAQSLPHCCQWSWCPLHSSPPFAETDNSDITMVRKHKILIQASKFPRDTVSALRTVCTLETKLVILHSSWEVRHCTYIESFLSSTPLWATEQPWIEGIKLENKIMLWTKGELSPAV